MQAITKSLKWKKNTSYTLNFYKELFSVITLTKNKVRMKR